MPPSVGDDSVQATSGAQCWQVVGGSEKGGIVVRTGMDLQAPKEDELLSTGAVVQGVELAGSRLKFVRVSGQGPDSGWVSVSVGDKRLLLPHGLAPPPQPLSASGRGAPSGQPLSLRSVFPLLDGNKMPVFGLGVYRSRPGKETFDAVAQALDVGYRLIDTAAMYGNEQSVGEAIRSSGLARKDVWITTKLRGGDHGYESAIEACRASLQRLEVGYLDLYLIHSPNGGKLLETWDALVELQRRGLVRSIGVSNYGVKHFEMLRSNGRPVPTVNQIEMHPLVYQERKNLIDYCQQHGIIVEAYGSIFSGQTQWLKDRTVSGVCASHPGKTAAQVLLRWALQHGFQIIPKSVHKTRLEENMGVFDFELTGDEMDALNRMRGNLGQYWNPLDAPLHTGRTQFGQDSAAVAASWGGGNAAAKVSGSGPAGPVQSRWQTAD